jgi:hypothetical protein
MDAKTHQVIGYLNPDNNCVWPQQARQYLWYLKGGWFYTPDGQKVGYIMGHAAELRRPVDEED